MHCAFKGARRYDVGKRRRKAAVRNEVLYKRSDCAGSLCAHITAELRCFHVLAARAQPQAKKSDTVLGRFPNDGIQLSLSRRFARQASSVNGDVTSIRSRIA
jgi:hypothetical protein